MITDNNTAAPQEGVLDGYTVEMETLEDTFEKAIAQYDYPYTDGVDLEDMGQKAHKLRIRCYFYDNAEQETYSTHIDLINNLTDKDLIDFVHPKYGLMKVKIEALVVAHDDRERTAQLDISLVEQMQGDTEPEANTDVLSAAEEDYISGQLEQLQTLISDIMDELPTADFGILTEILDPDLGLSAQVQGYSSIATAFVGRVESYIASAEAVVNQVVSPINSLQATITYALTLPGRILGSITGVAEKVALLYTSLETFPSQFISKIDDASEDLHDYFVQLGAEETSVPGQSAAAVMTKHLRIACAQRIALAAAAVYAADDVAFREGSGKNSVAAGMVYATAAQAVQESASSAAQPVQIMNIRELEETLAIVRTRLEAAVEIARDMDSLKQTAKNLLNHVNSVRLEREKMIKVTLDNPMPLHLVCLKYGLPYTDAERLLRINRIRQPNFTEGEVMVYAR